TRNLLRIAIFNISYIRGLFPEKYFNDKTVPALGVYDALQKKYLKTLLFSVCEAIEGPLIEEYAFSFSYSNSDSQEVSMNVKRSGDKKQGGTFKCDSTTEVTPNQMRSSACKMVRTLIQLMRTLDKMPEESLTNVVLPFQRTILMKLLYYDDVTPVDYEPPFFRGCTEQEAYNPWTKNPLKMEVGNVNSKHFVLALKVKSVLDPCEDENDEIEDDVSLGADSVDRDDDSSDSEALKYAKMKYLKMASHSEDDHYIVAPIGKISIPTFRCLVGIFSVTSKGFKKIHPWLMKRSTKCCPCADDTQDPAEDEQQLGRIKDWVNSHHLDTVELTDVLSNFPDISEVLIEEIVEKLVKEGLLTKSKTGKESYIINKHKKSDYEFNAVKEEADGQLVPFVKKAQQSKGEDHMYMKALYHALPMNYITIAKLQSKLEGGANQTTVRKLIDKMTQDGFLETTSNRRLGKRVIHSDLTEKKLMEVQKALDMNAMDADIKESHGKSNHPEIQTTGSNHRDMSTCGGLHSIGSDITRTKGRSVTYQNGSLRSDQTVSKMKDHGNTPTSNAQPVASRESFAPGVENGRANGKDNHRDEVDTVICSRSTQDKRCRKASM
ncbi:hypothetical protein RJ639_029200, partial [Escallonia herrerae]